MVLRFSSEPLKSLTARELQVLALMAQGYSNAGICELHHLSEKTVEAHVRAIFRKLGLTGCAKAHRRVTAVLIYLEAVDRGELAA